MSLVSTLPVPDQQRLVGVHPILAERIARVLQAMAALGFPMMITDGLRTVAQQQALFAQGRTAPGQIVTRADGIVARSNHQAHADGFGHAVDCCFVVDGKPSWSPSLPWTAYGSLGAAVGLVWGGAWPAPQIHDLPHLEVPDVALPMKAA